MPASYPIPHCRTGQEQQALKRMPFMTDSSATKPSDPSSLRQQASFNGIYNPRFEELPDGSKMIRSKAVRVASGNTNKTFYTFGSNTNIKQALRPDMTMSRQMKAMTNKIQDDTGSVWEAQSIKQRGSGAANISCGALAHGDGASSVASQSNKSRKRPSTT